MGDAVDAELTRRRWLGLLAAGLAVVLAGCSDATPPTARPAANSTPVTAPPVPAARPGHSEMVVRGPTAGGRIALTVDDGTSAEVVAGYVAFAQRTGIHLTFSPNGTYSREWSPHRDVLRPLVAAGQVQIINHAFTHHDLRTLSPAGIRDELARNDDWVVTTFGTTTRPYYRPPFGFHSPAIDDVAAGLGYTRTVMWNGSFSDSTVITPQLLMQEARRYLWPGVINIGHANHPAVLSVFDELTALIRERTLAPVTLDEMFGTSRATGAA